MGLLDIFFRRSKPEEATIQSEGLPSEQIERTEDGPVCASCKKVIRFHEKRKKFGKQIFHRKCFKKAKRIAENNVFR